MCDEIRIYVADLAAYNNGKLHGVWINACDDLDDMQDQINKMLSTSPEGFSILMSLSAVVSTSSVR
ncbi:MAG: antirestriction protein ArdA [Pseudomonadales bacterium]|nr:antirestriction protein ArdA [Pseudomonadales bacterium]